MLNHRISQIRIHRISQIRVRLEIPDITNPDNPDITNPESAQKYGYHKSGISIFNRTSQIRIIRISQIRNLIKKRISQIRNFNLHPDISNPVGTKQRISNLNFVFFLLHRFKADFDAIVTVLERHSRLRNKYWVRRRKK